jgi:membrane-bound lytic murein transglycosylase B
MRRLLGILICLFTALWATGIQAAPSADTQVQQFIQMMVKQYHFKNDYLQKLLADRKPNADIIKRITFPYESKPWKTYRKHFVKDTRIQSGVDYWKTHKKSLQAAQKSYGVPASVIVSIIGVESNYGHFSAHFNELDALTTLAFHYPKRAKFFRRELKEYLILTRKQKIDPNSLYGSYAGALGIPQFMPSSYKHYGVDFSKNGKIDLLNDHNDAIGSIANYLSLNGWQRGQAIASTANLKGPVARKYLKSRYKLSQWKQKGVEASKKLPTNMRARLIQMGNDKYWLVFRNFKAIMSYNPRASYAMAVYQLSREIEAAYEHQT